MYLSRISLSARVSERELVKIFCYDIYREHQALWKLFSNDRNAKRDFLYRQVFEHGSFKYYLLSMRKPHDHQDAWSIETKNYTPSLRAGQRLAFSLRANPVICIKDAQGKRKVCDVVMHKKRLINYKNLPYGERPALADLVQESCGQWLEERAAKNGFMVKGKEVRADGYREHVSRMPRGGQVRFRSVDFEGVLTVIEPKLFEQVLMQGIGKSKSFGCGLFLIKRI
ncbi:MAG: type I-E CRISPR-associated protein Cas6/Cse3/CasE [Pseudomonadota bacterium]|nr:type I-E CRISPR-associated protein Cas6/Cse3/CasE [Pseudomonadota bacterium]